MRYWENLIGVAKIDSNGAGSRTHSGGRRPLRIQVLVSTPDVGVQVPPRAPVKTVVPSWDGCFFAVAFLSAACYTFGVYARADRNILSQGGYEDEEEILDRDPYRRAAAESSAGDDAVGGGGRYVIDGD